MKNNRVQIKALCAEIMASIFTVLCAITASVQPIYGDVDNYVISLVANKVFLGSEQDGYIIHLNPLLCKVLEWAHEVMPMADCFMVVSNICLLVAIWAISYWVARWSDSYYKLIGSYVALFAVIYVNDMLHDNYTRWAAFFSAVGMILLVMCIHKQVFDVKLILVASVMLACGMMWRDEAFFVFLPFMAVEIVCSAIHSVEDRGWKEIFLYLGKVCFIPAIVCIVLLGLDWQTKNSSEYRAAVLYDNARVSVVDYPMKRWQEVTDVPAEISQNDYESIKKWLLMDTERIDVQYYNSVKEVAQKRAFNLDFNGLISAQKNVLSVFIDSEYFHFLGTLLVVVFILVIFSKVSWWIKLKICLLYMGMDIIFLYFAFVGRAIERGFLPAIYAVLTSSLIFVLTQDGLVKSRVYSLLSYLVVAIAVFFTVIEISTTDIVPEQSVWTSARDTENKYETLCEGENLYVWNIGSYTETPMQEFMSQGKLMTTDFMKHNIFDGSWTYGQVCYNQLLEEINASNPMRALLERENTYYVAEDYKYVLTYLQEHYDADTVVAQVGEVDYVPIWQFTVLE